MARSRFRYIALAAAFTFAPTAQACIGPAVMTIGKKLSPSQERAAAKKWMAAETVRRTADLKARNADGKVDVATELALLLTPNVRGEGLDESDCGPTTIHDLADPGQVEDPELIFARLVKGTPLEGRQRREFPERMLREISWPRYAGETCNKEVRRRLATYLGDNMFLGHLQEAWLFLSARQRDGYLAQRYYSKLQAFDGTTRAPPMRWVFATPELQKEGEAFLKNKVAGKALQANLDNFWAEVAPMLPDNALICPEESEHAVLDRKDLIDALMAYDAERQAKREAAQ